MRRYRIFVGLLVGYLSVLVGVQLYLSVRAPSDHTAYMDVPSRVYVAQSITASPSVIPDTAIDTLYVGALVLSVEDRKVASVEEVTRIAQSLTDTQIVTFRVFRPGFGQYYKWTIRRDLLPDPATFLIDLPPSLYVAGVTANRTAERAGVHPGDIITGINGEPLVDSYSGDRLLEFRVFLAGLSGYHIETALQADAAMVRSAPRDTLAYEVLRGNEVVIVPIELEPFGLGSYQLNATLLFTLLPPLFAIACMVLGACMLWRRQDSEKARRVLVAVGIVLFVLHALLMVAFHWVAGSADYFQIAALALVVGTIWVGAGSDWKRSGATFLFAGFVGLLLNYTRELPPRPAIDLASDLTLALAVLMILPVGLSQSLVTLMELGASGADGAGKAARRTRQTRPTPASGGSSNRLRALGRNALTGLGKAAITTAVLTVSVWLAFKALQFWLDLPPDDYSYNTIPGLANKLFNRGFVPYGIMGTMFFALARLRSIHRSKLGTDEAAAGSIAADHPANEKVRETTETMTASQWQAWLDAQYRATLPGAGGADKVGDPGATGFYASCRSKLVARQSPDRDIRVVSAMRDEILAAEEDDLARSMVPVRWCENTLPVLGFLGTVIGMGTAIGAMGTTIRSIARNRLLAPDDFASAFDGMMIAFDTTFLGLIGLLVVSLYHTTLRRKLSAGLAGTREFTDIVIDRLKNEAVVDELGAILVENHLTRDLSASTRSLALHAIAQGDDPTLRAIRKALLAPVVEFEELGGLADRLRDHVTGEVDNGEWEIDALGFPVSRDSWGCAALTVQDRKGTKHFILTFDLEATTLVPLAPASQLVELFPGHHPGVLLGREASGETVLLERRAESDAPYVRRPLESVGGQRARQSHAIRIEQVIHVLLVDDADVAVVLDRGAETLLDRGAETLAAQAFAVRVGGQRPDPLEPIPLPRGYEWTDWATHPASATLLAVGKAKKGGGWKVLILRVGRRSGRLELTDEFRKEIPLSGVEPRRIVALSGDEFLVLDTAGNLHYRHPHFKGFRPVRDAADAGWRPADHADSRIWPGRNGWIAVRRADKLEMWQVGYPGVLRRYDGEPVDFGDAGDGRSDAMARVAAQGEYLVTVARTNGRGPRKLQTIGGWRFPQTAMDSFS